MKMTNPNSLLFVDIGNSRIKLFKEGVKISYNYKFDGFAENLAQYLSSETFNTVVYSSVNINAENIFLLMAKRKKNVEFINVKDLLINQNIIDLSEVHGIGNDRWLGILGATAYCDPPLVTVDCGTAVTVNFLDYKYSVLGGAIFAGAFTQKNNLASISDKLKFDKFNFSPNVAGTDTSSALSLGIIYSVAGGIRLIIERMAENHHLDNPSIFITGGYGGKILKIISKEYPRAIYDENLIFRGMAKIYESIIK
jgi:type III pantothenate kinase